MKHQLIQINSFEIIDDFKLKIYFSDGITNEVDFLPMLKGEIYGPLSENSFFRKVKIDPEVKTLVWPNGADFDPSILYNWDAVKKELIERANTWCS